MANTCSICCENFNKTSRKATVCGSCNLQCCQACQKHYLLESTVDAHCMGCRKGFTRDALATMLSKAFVATDYKKHRENILFEREKCLMPATQLEVERDLHIESLKVNLTQIRCARSAMKKASLDMTVSEEDKTSLRAEIEMLDKEIQALSGEIWVLNRRVKVEEEVVVAVKKCPNDECKGFLNKDWECGLCNTHLCKHCHTVLGEGEHTCKPEDIETAKLLAKETKDCPACGTTIFKISGCDQMWCTQCHTAFSWNTLKIEKGVIHNPHFYEYQRQTNGGLAPRVPGDVPGGNCQELPHILTALPVWRRTYKGDKLNFLMSLHCTINHFRYVVLGDRFGVRPAEAHVENRDLRKKYLRNLMSEDTFKNKIQRREKERMLEMECDQVLEMFVTCVKDLMLKSFEEDTVDEMKQLVDYFNGAMKRTADIYKCNTYKITEEGKHDTCKA